jgi:S-formylglutathione hydrolase FrmB
VKRAPFLVALLIMAGPPSAAAGGVRGRVEFHRIIRSLAGQIVDYTHNNGADRRIWSEALQQPRDLYVYLPPGYSPEKRYPLLIWLHGFAQDEQSFVFDVVRPLDTAIASGQLPPVVVAAPDGSLAGEPSYRNAGSFFINSKAGNFEDFVSQDVWSFMVEHYSLRPEAEAHVLAGVSMGGGAAYNLAIKYRDRFRIVLGIFPPLNLRWLDCHCRYMRSRFDPCCWGWRTDFTHGHEVVGRFYLIFAVHLKNIVGPLFPIGPETTFLVSEQNPIEMLDTYDVKPGELSMFVAYGGKDQFNIETQVESFLFRAKERCLTVDVSYQPRGKHDLRTALKFLPDIINWLAPKLAPYSPAVEQHAGQNDLGDAHSSLPHLPSYQALPGLANSNPMVSWSPFPSAVLVESRQRSQSRQ